MAQSDGSINKRSDGRSSDALREIKFTRGWLNHAEGSVIVEFGQTRVLCAASFTAGVPRWMAGQGKGCIQCCRARPIRDQIVKALKENWEDALKKFHV